MTRRAFGGFGRGWQRLKEAHGSFEDMSISGFSPDLRLASYPAARIEVAAEWSITSVNGLVSVWVGAQARSDASKPADVLRDCLSFDPSAWPGHPLDTCRWDGVTK